MKSVVLSGALLALASACASVPSDAPTELQAADSAIKHAERVDADDTAPKTLDKAKAKLRGSVALFEKSKSKEKGAEDDLANAKSEANLATQMADNAASLHTDVLAWDEGGLADYQAMIDQGKALDAANTEIAKLKAQGPTTRSEEHTSELQSH